jgi:hypothetical protein
MNVPQSRQSAWHRIWIALRFLMFACGGLVVLSFGITHFVGRVFGHDRYYITPFLSLPIVFVSLFMLLYGTGEWGRWRFLFVFTLMPISFSVPIWIYWLIAGRMIPMPIPFLAMGIVGFLTHAAVRKHYARCERAAVEGAEG